jgi:hypothetical protein
MNLIGSNPHPQTSGSNQLPGTTSYFIGQDPAGWHTDIPTYARVRYGGVYPNIDLVYYGSQGNLEYDFVVAPGADPSAIQMAFTGMASLSLDAGDNLVLHTSAGDVRQQAPAAYQEIGGEHRPVDVRYRLADGSRVSFLLGSYDHSLPLVIDPMLSYSTYYGNSGDDYGNGVAVDANKNAYMVGSTTSGFQAQVAFVSKFDPTGSTVLYTSYIGDNHCDSSGSGIAVDSAGDAVLTGLYGSQDQWGLCNNKNVLASKLNPTGTSFLYSFYFGGNDDHGNAVALDSAGNAYITGQTNGNFPTTAGAYQTSGGFPGDAFVTKIDPAGNVVYSTYLGGGSIDEGFGIAVDRSGNAYVAGWAQSVNFPVTAGAFQPHMGSGAAVNGFVTKLNAAGSALLYSTFIGGSHGDNAAAVAVDGQGNAYVTGNTESSDFPTTANAYDRSCGTDGACNAVYTCDPGGCGFQYAEDIFVAKINPALSGAASLLYSTFLGGMNRDLGQGIAVDANGRAYITGRTASIGDFPLVNPLQATIGGDFDAFVAEIDPAQAGAASLIFSTYLGGTGYDQGNAIALDADGNAYVTGYTGSATTFPVLNPLQAAKSGGYDAFLSKIGNAAGVNAFTLTPGTVSGGGAATGTVTLGSPAPAGGAVVGLASSNGAVATVPATVTVAAGASSASLTVTAGTVSVTSTATISATYGGATRSSVLTVTPVASLTGLTLAPTSVVGGKTARATITLDRMAPAGGIVVNLASSNAAAATLPSTATVAAGAVTATVTATSKAVAVTTPVTISATFSGVTKSRVLTVTPPAALVRTPSSGSVQSKVVVTGTNFGASEAVKVYWDTTSTSPVSSTTSTAMGTFAVTFSVPYAVSGTHTIIAVGQSSAISATTTFKVTPRVVLAHVSGQPGAQNIVYGYGFGASETVTATWGSTGGLKLGTATTTGLGTFSGASAITFTTPMSPSGSYSVYAVGKTSKATASTPFTLTPSLQITPTSGAQGITATITGAGYAAGDAVTLKWDCSGSTCSSTTVLGTPSANSSGGFSASVSLPKGVALGNHTIGGRGGSSSAFASAVYNVTA